MGREEKINKTKPERETNHTELLNKLRVAGGKRGGEMR